MINRKALKIGEQVERPVAAGVDNIEEGALLCAVIEDGVEKVTVKATVDGSEKIAGFAITPYQLPTSAVAKEQFVVPSAGSLIFNLRNSRVIADSELASVVGGSDLTVDETNFSATPPTGTVKVDLVGGRIKFAAGDAGKVVNFLYRHELTVVQARQRYQERSINNRDLVGALQQVGVAKGYVEMATDQFDTSINFAAATSLKIGDNGLISDQSGAGAEINQGRVLALPDLTDTAQGAYLKISALIG